MRNISLNYDQLQVLNKFSLWGESNRFICLLGPSGVGKTSILNVFAGILKPNSGFVSSGAERLAYVFQEPRLLPWMTVEQNTEVGLYKLSKNKDWRRKKVRQVLQKIGLEKFSEYYPEQLSGGMKQRVSIGRAYVIQPDLLLLDEPFNGLDEALKTEMQDLLVELANWHMCTTIMVTHDIREAIKLGDRFIVIDGRPGHIALDITVNLAKKKNPDYRPALEKEIFSVLHKTNKNMGMVNDL
jgi:ABC-type nitrate/sulfonate/bicarbonate transport system ATPase subunit